MVKEEILSLDKTSHMYIEALKISIPVLVAITGWLIGNYFSNRRAQKQKKRDLTLNHVIDAYRTLVNEIAHRGETPERNRKLEALVTDIQLFGSLEQAKLARKLADDVAAGGTFQLDPLINSLRNDLRKELKLKPIDGNVRWLRMQSNEMFNPFEKQYKTE
ncbi:hypothetical protein [Carboxylicivirga sp. RSCT41]|uniref:hypothetical protein n=1 Tax=Carboxylicivirga agarovorans TaxID=3417570 RepID=UPI003D3461C5